mgnify:CR=1 FL=1
MSTLLVKNIGVLQTPVGSFSHKGEQQGENLKLKDAAILIEDGIIKEAVRQHGRKIVVDADLALKLFDQRRTDK